MDRFNGAEAAVRMLQLYGVRHIFGLCGDTSLPFYDALYRMEHGITHVLTRDERSAAGGMEAGKADRRPFLLSTLQRCAASVRLACSYISCTRGGR